MSDPPPADPPSRASSLAAGLILLLIVLTPVVGFVWLRGMSRAAFESNSLNHTGNMLLRHFVRTGGEWPASWDDLAEDFEPADAGYGTPSIEALKQIVSVDFTFDPATVGRDGANHDQPSQVIWLTDREESPAVRAANSHLIDALRKRHLRNEQIRESP